MGETEAGDGRKEEDGALKKGGESTERGMTDGPSWEKRRTEGVDKYESKKKGGGKRERKWWREKGRINEFEENEEGEGKKDVDKKGRK